MRDVENTDEPQDPLESLVSISALGLHFSILHNIRETADRLRLRSEQMGFDLHLCSQAGWEG
jgi:hypothetical protein